MYTVPVEPNLDDYVRSFDFDKECQALQRVTSSSDEGGSSEDDSLWSSDDSVSSATTADSSPHEVSKIESNLYYAGVGPKGRGPKLIYRTSKDKFEEPSGPEAYKRVMRLIGVPRTHDLGPNATWDMIRDQARGLLLTQ